ncbi:VWA domain-containing protein [Streptomyces sp. S1A1-8]|uniref:vWA domain-containing protein n=1 Tax=unclassified Streptomyces TaxID=2593676 RepID=UPI0011624B24|nr:MULTISPECIES: VWA domain-containing protein [unclassified Streptomyces]QDO02412.1 VWA domain-containing protein [Streptomyces sp. RLB1-9]QDO24146.1 VWA domain-containing protein [Streptomyces sp. S1A1-8]QDO34270.1 VWA domain-containing protein [Streptomyces sp. S1A1-3]
MPDLPELAASFTAALHDAGIAVGPDRTRSFARALTLLAPSTTRELRHCALATLVSDPEQIEPFDAVFREVFGGPADREAQRGQPGDPARSLRDTVPGRVPGTRKATGDGRDREADAQPREAPVPLAASPLDRLAGRDFAELSAEELARLSEVMRTMVLRTPTRPSRRRRTAHHGARIDVRRTLSVSRRTGGYPLRLRRFVPRARPRDLIVLCDISGSMEPYARAMLQLLYCAARATHAEVFTFATRLTRLTPVLRRAGPDDALARAGRAAPDWSGGTRIAECLAEFNERFGRRGMAHGAVVAIISDGWDTGTAAELATQMARLSRVAHRVVWVNPRTASPRYRPLVAGMAAALPYCDAVVSAHNLEALGDFTAVLSAPRRRR